MRIMLSAAWLSVLSACGDDRLTSDVATADTVTDATIPDVSVDATTAPDAAPTTCEAELTEVDSGFVEVEARGPCARYTIELRDAASFECALQGNALLEDGRATYDIEVPAAALIVLRTPDGAAWKTWTFGTCAPAQGCISFATEPLACLPADTPQGSVSRCGGSWLAGRTPTPRAANDCRCRVDCAAAANQCQTGACVDGECRFESKPDGTACGDESLCTSDDHCAAGACVGTAVSCGPPPGPCAKAGICVPATGACIFPDHCGPNASCGASGCACDPGFSGDGATCEDIDECASDPCPEGATCLNFPGTYQCACPPGTSGPGCVASTCDCPWEPAATCGAEVSSLEVRVTDLWGQPIEDATVLVENELGDLVGYSFEGDVSVPLCRAFFGKVTVEAPVHHGFAGDIRWSGTTFELDQVAPSRDHAWALTQDAAGYVLSVGLAHRWLASSGRPARHGNRLRFMRDGEESWRAVHDAIMDARSLVTGTSWWWMSDFEVVRDRASDPYLSESERWLDTILGTLEQAPVDRKILVNQFVSQDGLLSGQTVDDWLTAKGETAGDDFDFMGQANTAEGTFEVALPSIDYAARAEAWYPLGDLVADSHAEPYLDPFEVDMTALPLGLSYFDLPLASWHQKFWTIDQEVAFIGGMNAKATDWDTHEHRVFDALRMDFDASQSDREAVIAREKEPDHGPRKDYMMRIDGPIVADAVAIFKERWDWLLGQGVDYAENATSFVTEDPPGPHADGLQAQVVATMPAPFDENAILETLLRAIENAQSYIYIEDQYFRAPVLYDAIVQRMAAEPDLVLIVATNQVSEWTDPGCWQTAIAYERFMQLYPDRFRIYKLRAYDVVRTDCTFCFDETEAHFVDFDLHSKLVLVDDEYLEVGSCNSNNRGLYYEGELAVAVHDAAFASDARREIFANMLGPGYAGDLDPRDLVRALDEVAARNQAAYDAWDDEGMDLDLDGDPIPDGYTPQGFVYPLVMDPPDDCLIEDIGSDVT